LSQNPLANVSELRVFATSLIGDRTVSTFLRERDRLPAIVAGIKGADPTITLQGICDRLEAMRERTPRGRSSWQPSSVRMLLARAEKLGML
jgi:hypothetical protein